MGLFRKPPRRSLPPLPRWVWLGLLMFVAFLGLQFQQRPEIHTPIFTKAEEFKALGSSLPLINRPKVVEVEVGKGAPLLCGQKAQLLLVPIIAQKALTPQQLTIHAGKSTLLITQFLSGMRIGGVRDVALNATLEGAALHPSLPAQVDGFRVTLLGASPDVAALFRPDALALGLADGETGSGAIARCGDAVSVKVMDAGKESALTLTLGDNTHALGLEQGIIGMQVGGTRNITLPPAWQSKLGQRATHKDSKTLQVQLVGVE